MKRINFALALLACLAMTAGLAAEAVLKDGYAPGQSTMDWDAALAYAKQNKLPVFVDFTGSDWCGWCKLMQANVFTKAAWTDWAKNRLVLVTIDFPNDKSIVPEKYRARNQELSDRFGIEGYPTYVRPPEKVPYSEFHVCADYSAKRKFLQPFSPNHKPRGDQA
jgi:thiol:disulfide interchange protein